MVYLLNRKIAEGDTWIRANRMVIENPINQKLRVTFAQEEVINIGENRYFNQIEPVSFRVDPSSQEEMTRKIKIINPETGEVSDQEVSLIEIYSLMYSLYIDTFKAHEHMFAEEVPAIEDEPEDDGEPEVENEEDEAITEPDDENEDEPEVDDEPEVEVVTEPEDDGEPVDENEEDGEPEVENEEK